MNVTVIPSKATGTVSAPPSKSAAHRALICAGLAEKESVLHGIARSEDISATLDCLRALGASIRTEGDTVFVRGTDPGKLACPTSLFCRECGSTLRFFVPIALLGSAPVSLYGSERLLARPMNVYENIAEKARLGYEIFPDHITVRGPLSGGEFRFPGDVSSQFVSGLMFALPLAKEDSVITLIPPIASKPYIDMTRKTLSEFGIRIIQNGENSFLIPGNQSYHPCETHIEGDHSNAAFLKAFALLSGDLLVGGLDENSLQGDKICSAYFEALTKGFCRIDITDQPDLGPILFTVAALYHGAEFTGTDRLKAKESDRGEAMAEELRKCGACVEIGNNTVTVRKSELHAPRQPLYGHNDHRVVMSLTVLLSVLGGEIEGAEAVNKSYPDFFEVIGKLGIEVKTNGMDL